MTPVTENAENAELQALKKKLLACSPSMPARLDNPELRIRDIEWRSRLATTRRRWFLGSAVAAVTALVLGVLGASLYIDNRTPSSGPPTMPAPAAVESRLQQYSAAQDPAVLDLGPAIGRVMLRPNTKASYAPKTRTLVLQRGKIVAHILPDGRGFRVRFGRQAVVVKGTLFSVDSETGSVRVWHGVVEHDTGKGRQVIRGTGEYNDLSSRDMAWLAFTPPREDHSEEAGTKPAPVPKKKTPTPAYRPDPVRQHLLDAQKEMATGRAEQALQLLERYEAQFPSSPLLEEAWLLKIRALAHLKRFRRLQQVSHVFLKRFPHSAKTDAVKQVLQRASDHVKKTRPR